MDHFQYIAGQLHAEQVSLAEIATRFGTPCYVYSRATLEHHWRAFDDALGSYPHQICYAVKANGNLAILNLLARLGSGFDIVSGGELQRVLAAGGTPETIVFSGVGKQEWEIHDALNANIACFNIESESELHVLRRLARKLGKVATISVRLNPDVDAKTHPYISTGLRENKFGLMEKQALAVYSQAATDPHLRISGISCHIGSQLTDLTPYKEALRHVLHFSRQLNDIGIKIMHINVGGGLGVRYRDETPPSPAEYGKAMVNQMQAHLPTLPITVEPGRSIVGAAGILLTRVNYLKHGELNHFCVVDAGMNDLIRPALYQAYQEITEVEQDPPVDAVEYDVVGPVCEGSDFLGKRRMLKVRESDLLAVRTAGAYGSVMSSNYNARPRSVEVMVDGDQCYLIRKKESVESLYQDEYMLP